MQLERRVGKIVKLESSFHNLFIQRKCMSWKVSNGNYFAIKLSNLTIFPTTIKQQTLLVRKNFLCFEIMRIVHCSSKIIFLERHANKLLVPFRAIICTKGLISSQKICSKRMIVSLSREIGWLEQCTKRMISNTEKYISQAKCTMSWYAR